MATATAFWKQPPHYLRGRNTSHRPSVAFHEAAHAVAAFILGRDFDWVETPVDGRVDEKAAGRVTMSATLGDIEGNPDAARAEAIVCLAGMAAMREFGWRTHGDADREMAMRCCAWGSATEVDGRQLFREAEARTNELVASYRFKELFSQLGTYLTEPEHQVISGDYATRLLRAWDGHETAVRNGGNMAGPGGGTMRGLHNWLESNAIPHASCF